MSETARFCVSCGGPRSVGSASQCRSCFEGKTPAHSYTFRGDFRIIKLDGMFHVVFRPDGDPEWFRIVASFFTYERAWMYCDLERVTSFHGESTTTDEMAAGRCEPPAFTMPDPQGEWDAAGCARDIMPDVDKAVPPIPPEARAEVCEEQPDDNELPKDYDSRMFNKAVRAVPSAKEAIGLEIAKAADRQAVEQPAPSALPEPAGELSDKQASVLRFLTEKANPAGLVTASLAQISGAAGVPHGSISFLLETLERKGLAKKVESGSGGGSSIYKVLTPAA